MRAISRILAILAIAAGCSGPGGRLSPEEYRDAVFSKSGHCFKKREVGGYIFEAQYLPPAFLAMKEHGGQLTKEQIRKKEKDLAETAQFSLYIQTSDAGSDLLKGGVGSQEEYGERVEYFSFLLQDDIYMEQGGQKIPCSMYHFERIYSLQPGRRFTVGFEGVDNTLPFKLVVDAKPFGTGPVKMNFTDTNTYSLGI